MKRKLRRILQVITDTFFTIWSNSIILGKSNGHSVVQIHPTNNEGKKFAPPSTLQLNSPSTSNEIQDHEPDSQGKINLNSIFYIQYFQKRQTVLSVIWSARYVARISVTNRLWAHIDESIILLPIWFPLREDALLRVTSVMNVGRHSESNPLSEPTWRLISIFDSCQHHSSHIYSR